MLQRVREREREREAVLRGREGDVGRMAIKVTVKWEFYFIFLVIL